MDYPEDFELVKRVFAEVKLKNIFGYLEELVKIVDDIKDIKELNSQYYFGQGWK